MTVAWKAGDWAVFDRDVVMIKEIREGESCSVSNGHVETSGQFLDRLRPLTLRNKHTVEWFESLYDSLRKIRGEGGFNWPDISRHFSALTLRALDNAEDDSPFNEAREFVQQARDYRPYIQGVSLFR